MSKVVFKKNIRSMGIFTFRPFDLSDDIPTIHSWVIQPYAVYWGMNGNTIQQTISVHEELLERPDYDIFIGEINGKRVCMMERYLVSSDILANYYQAKDSDRGMHILVAPKEKRIPNFTWHIFSSVIDFIFSESAVERVVVEPDSNNEKIHRLNRKAGFQYQKEIDMPHKKACLAWCTREDYEKALTRYTQFALENE